MSQQPKERSDELQYCMEKRGFVERLAASSHRPSKTIGLAFEEEPSAGPSRFLKSKREVCCVGFTTLLHSQTDSHLHGVGECTTRRMNVTLCPCDGGQHIKVRQA